MRRLFGRFAVLSSLALVSTCIGLDSIAVAQQALAPRIAGEIASSGRVTVPGTRPPRALPANDTGAVAVTTTLSGMTLVFARSEPQEAALQTLLAAQQNPSSPLFHQWLTPEQFATRFGMADADLAKTQAWLRQQGFLVEAVSRSHDRITFAGTAGQVASAFGAELHHFTVGGETHFAPATDISLPGTLAGVVRTVGNLSDFRPHSHVVLRPAVAAKPEFTSSSSGNHFLTPKDVATIYDISAAYNAGYTGTGQTIVVVGQSGVATSDVTNFQNAAGLSVKAPTLVLVPNTGSTAISADDEVESDLDLEYTGGIARGASIVFVYTGNGGNAGAFDSIVYAIDNDLAPIISVSYGDCEADLGSTYYAQYNAALAQGAAQGQSVVAASGDNGSTDCYEDTNLTAAVREGLAVDFPADSQYVTGLGGSEFPAADVASTNTTYWTAASGSDVISSALSYIPEQVWNDDSTSGIGSGGGGTSTLTARPSWQAGVTGIPAGTFRLVPDLALAASAEYPGYLYCSTSTATGITGSCSNGFRDVNSQYLTVVGGTSVAAPVFAGMLAIINQAKNYNTGQGLINPTLYTLASNAPTYASAFHDITSGSNECLAGSTYCSTTGASEWLATTGYDEASGLGSVDLYNLLTAWPAATTASTFTITPSSTALNLVDTSGATVTDTINLTSINSFAGTVALTCTATTSSGSAAGTCSLSPTTGTLTAAGTATSTLTIVDTVANATGTLTVKVTGTSGTTTVTSSTITVTVATPTFTVTPSATALSITSGATSGNTVSLYLASVNSYAAAVALSCSLTASTATYQPTCTVSPTSVALAANGTGTATVTIGSTAARGSAVGGGVVASRGWSLGGGTAFALLLFCTSLRKRRRMFGAVLTAGLLAVGLGMLSGCSGESGGTTLHSSAGTYTATITATGTPTGGGTATSITTMVTVTIN